VFTGQAALHVPSLLPPQSSLRPALSLSLLALLSSLHAAGFTDYRLSGPEYAGPSAPFVATLVDVTNLVIYFATLAILKAVVAACPLLGEHR
jgi:hypothetical protein